MLDSMFRCRIDKQTLEAVTPILEGMGLTVSGAIRIFLKRIEQTGEFPIDLGQQSSSQAQVAGIAAALEFLRYQERTSAEQKSTNSSTQRSRVNAPLKK
jgi:addiction module RelB/DinJ family antitoxin